MAKVKLPKELQAKFAGFQRELPGLWMTGELTEFLGVSPSAINMAVRRGQLSPARRIAGQQMIFTDDEVRRYLAEPQRPGRPRRYQEKPE